MYCGRCCVTEPRSRAALRLDIFIEILLRCWVNRSGLPYLRAKDSGYVVPCKLVTVAG